MKANEPHSYYKDPEPWKHEPKTNIWKQILVILLVIGACFLIFHFALQFGGYNWNDFGFVKMLSQMIEGNYPITKPPARF